MMVIMLVMVTHSKWSWTIYSCDIWACLFQSGTISYYINCTNADRCALLATHSKCDSVLYYFLCGLYILDLGTHRMVFFHSSQHISRNVQSTEFKSVFIEKIRHIRSPLPLICQLVCQFKTFASESERVSNYIWIHNGFLSRYVQPSCRID